MNEKTWEQETNRTEVQMSADCVLLMLMRTWGTCSEANVSAAPPPSLCVYNVMVVLPAAWSKNRKSSELLS